MVRRGSATFPERAAAISPGTCVALTPGMQSANTSEGTPGIEGPDYLALVIEWNDEDADTLVGCAPVTPTRRTSTSRTIAAVLGALGALALAVWGIRRLRAA